MSDTATAVAPPPTKPERRLGSFVIDARLPSGGAKAPGVALAAVRGAEETAHAGVAGVAHCLLLPESDPAAERAAAEHLRRAAALRHPALLPPIEAEVAGRIAYRVDPATPGQSLADRLRTERPLPAAAVATVVAGVAEGLAAAHAEGLTHGALAATDIWLDPQGVARLGGLMGWGADPAGDQMSLAAVAMEMLSAGPWQREASAGAAGPLLVERLRGEVTGLTERVAGVLARALEPDPARRFPSVAEFGEELRRAVADAAADIVAGAWEAISRQDLAMAGILADLAERYGPERSDLALLRLHLAPSAAGATAEWLSPGGQTIAAVPPIDPSGLDGMPPQGSPSPLSGAQAGERDPFIDPALRALFAPPVVATTTPKSSPWVGFAAGTFFLVMLMVLVIVATLAAA